MEKATFAAGCFWGGGATFEQVDGVIGTRVGYTGGSKDSPSYKEVCAGSTGHAEALEVSYDPARVSYDDLLRVFWMNHDPTTPNRQGLDVGEQYRSVIFFHSPEQEAVALRSKQELEDTHAFRRPIVTQIVPAGRFWEAEEDHQKYYSRRGMVAACNR